MSVREYYIMSRSGRDERMMVEAQASVSRERGDQEW